MRVKIKIVESDNVVLPGVGQVVGEVEYHLGSHGTYWDPPDPAEIGDCDLKVVGGGSIDNLFDNEEVVIALEDAVGTLYATQQAEFGSEIFDDIEDIESS